MGGKIVMHCNRQLMRRHLMEALIPLLEEPRISRCLSLTVQLSLTVYLIAESSPKYFQIIAKCISM
jgi:hypothetical protein